VAALVAAVLVLLAVHPADAAKKKRSRKKTPEPTAVPRAPDPYKVTFTTPDGVTLAATWRPVPGNPDASAVLLLHDFSRDRRTWEPFVPDLLARGLASLAVDLRGHGESTRSVKGNVHLSPRLLQDPNAFPRDTETACRWLRARSRKVGVLGLSLGANLALLATANGWADAGVAVSANVDRLAPLAGALSTKGRGLFVLASEQDAGRAQSARVLDQAGLPPKKAVLLPGAAHNLALFDTHPEAKAAALDWLVGLLGVAPPTPTPTSVPIREDAPFAVTPVPERVEFLPTPAPTPTPEPDLPTPVPQ
jgi:pimeloyl-ACP methyl ester carboxylesterase